MRTKVLAVLAFVVLAAAPAAAQDVDLRPVVEAALSKAALPAHEALAAAAAGELEAVRALCDAPADASLSAARAGFIALAKAYGGVEPFRLGPAVEDNRFERLLFWPDRRSRGQRQIEALIAAGGEADVAVLRGKSVAVQGLSALELLLYGSGAETLASAQGSARCRYGVAVAGAIALTADELVAGWRSFGRTLLAAGEGGASPYRSHAEVVKDLLEAAAELLQADATLKLGENVIGAAPGEGNPRLAPLWRSGATVSLILGNAETLAALATPELQAALAATGDDAAAIRFELAQVARALGPLAGTPLTAAAADAGGHRRLRYATGPLAAAYRLFAQRVPAAFGFATGFNAMDGD